MPAISFTDPKGGAGKTTSALILATELAARRAQVTIIDADPEKWISQWAVLDGKPENIKIFNEVTEDSIPDQIDDALLNSQFVIVDLEGTASLMVANLKARQQDVDVFYAIADANGWVLGEALEHAVLALHKEFGIPHKK